MWAPVPSLSVAMMNRRAGWGISLRVLNEIVDDALEQPGIDVHDPSITVDPEGPVPHIEFGDKGIDQSAHICRPAMEDPSVGIEPLEIDHFVNEVLQLKGVAKG